jgi:hypothetical protein
MSLGNTVLQPFCCSYFIIIIIIIIIIIVVVTAVIMFQGIKVLVTLPLEVCRNPNYLEFAVPSQFVRKTEKVAELQSVLEVTSLLLGDGC